MAGLIQQQMNPGAPQGAPAQPQQPPDDESMEMDQSVEQEGGDADENDPAYQQALKLALDALYKDKAAKDIAKQLQKSDDISYAMANVAYDIVSIVDERTEGRVPDEMLFPLASDILEEVADIAKAAGVQVTPANAAEAVKIMILRYLGENGYDTTELQGAMDKVNVEDFNKLAAEGPEQEA